MTGGLPVLLAAALVACNPQVERPADTDGGTGDEEDDGDTQTDDDNGTGSGATDSAEGSGTGMLPVDVPARGIRISRVDANPGVGIPIVLDGAWVDGPQRAAQIPRLRNTAFRVYVDVDESVWVQRPIQGRMRVIQPDATESVYRETVEIAMDSSTASLQSNILFGVLAEDMQPGAQFQIELWEASEAYESLPAVETPPVAPPEPEIIGIEGSVQHMRMMMVPIAYDFGGCSTVFDTSPETMKRYEDAMFQENGLESIDIQVHAPLPYTGDLRSSGGFFGLLNQLVQLRASESPDPNVYYYGIFDNCGDCIGDSGGCLLGVAPGQPGPSMGEAGSRVAIGVQYLGGSEMGMETFVHEIGHTQGRAHVACPGMSAAGPDPSYPYEDGKIGVWGFGVRDFEIRNPTTYSDYMSYCTPTWVSDWQWKATFERIRELSSWDAGDMGELEKHHVLVLTHDTDTGETHAWTDRGWVDGEVDEDYALQFRVDDEVRRTVTPQVQRWSEGPWVTVRAPLPDAFEAMTAVDLRTPSARIEVPAARIQRFSRR